jgi:hypothetical protein
MISHSLRSAAYGSLAVLGVGGLVIMSACLCPPCPGAGGATAAAAPVTPGGMGMGNAATPAPVVGDTVAGGTRLAIWDGDGAGAGAQGWESCDKAPNCVAKVGPEGGTGVNGSNGLKLHGEGPGFIGMGWNLFGWYPETAGVDLSPYTNLTFQIRVEAKSPTDAPEPGAVTVLLGCSKNKNDSASISVERYAKGFTDGKWHKVSIPISAFKKGNGAQFDLQSFWEFRIATWSAAPRHFDIFVDDIAAEKQ